MTILTTHKQSTHTTHLVLCDEGHGQTRLVELQPVVQVDLAVLPTVVPPVACKTRDGMSVLHDCDDCRVVCHMMNSQHYKPTDTKHTQQPALQTLTAVPKLVPPIVAAAAHALRDVLADERGGHVHRRDRAVVERVGCVPGQRLGHWQGLREEKNREN